MRDISKAQPAWPGARIRLIADCNFAGLVRDEILLRAERAVVNHPKYRGKVDWPISINTHNSVPPMVACDMLNGRESAVTDDSNTLPLLSLFLLDRGKSYAIGFSDVNPHYHNGHLSTNHYHNTKIPRASREIRSAQLLLSHEGVLIASQFYTRYWLWEVGTTFRGWPTYVCKCLVNQIWQRKRGTDIRDLP